MKSQSITLHASTRPQSSGKLADLYRAANRLPRLVFVVLASVIPPIGLIVLATWASNTPALLPAVQAAMGLSGLVFLALAMDAGRQTAVLYITTSILLFALSWASMSVSTELVVVAAMLVAAWTGAGLFSVVRRTCL